MSDIPRLVRLASKRAIGQDYVLMRFKARRSLSDGFRRKTMEDGISGNAVLEAFLQGYLNSHPAVLAMIDQWTRDSSGKQQASAKGPKLSRRELDEIYAEVSRDMIERKEEENG